MSHINLSQRLDLRNQINMLLFKIYPFTTRGRIKKNSIRITHMKQ